MVKMVFHLFAMEQDINQVHQLVNHIASDFQGFDDNPAVISLRSLLEDLQRRQQEAIDLWPQLGAPV